ncbi:glutathione-dependent formaldehyde-activating protein [Pelagibacterium halotolerans B2]|uniref:Glutathione-dependent formaldehyde-activating protein n=1 Tax=Pelagibacterium halotolerans (strain DSM 22347 / JCM 15775 / CGMCC 1.7692 / B2) TaxID=1082931 RepID=G4RDG8_PELHB|nr:glutathione-dependent formaldehyde-activating protein [Pelagibacterium halotolerans B2]
MCGSVAYEVEDAFRYALNCHCTDCRKATGAAFKPIAGIEAEKLSIISGHDNVLRYGGGAPGESYDIHCKLCGSLLYSIVQKGTRANVSLGTLTDAPSIKPTMHIFVGSKAPWYEITDDLPQHERFP